MPNLAQQLRVLPAKERIEQPQRPHLTAVRPVPGATPKRGVLTLVIIAIVAVLTIFVTQLWLSVAISQGAYTANDLILEERDLVRIERVMEQEVFLLSSPQHLSQEAVEQGMVQNAQPAFLALEGSVIQGELSQRSSEARPNTVNNAALTEFTTPEAVALQAEREAREAARAEAEAEAAAHTAALEAEAAAQVASTTQRPSGPIAWEGTLPAPNTH